MIVGTLPEEKYLLILESLYAILQVIRNLITRHPVLQVFFPIPIAHYLVKFLQLKPPAGQNGFHCLVDVRCQCLRIYLCQHFWFELS